MTESRASLANDDPLDALIAECLEQLSRGDSDPLEAMCAAHPAQASELRRRQAGLQDLGLWSRPPTAVQQRIGSFQLMHELGRGGMGVVHLAQQLGPIRRLAAVKVVAGRSTAQALARFDTERQALAMLVHPNIAQVLEAGTSEEGQPWYAMEFVDGLPIGTYCRDNRLDIAARLTLFLQLCDAVQFAHQQGVLHRDLKPGNVLVCERGGRPLVKVIDFGLAKALQEPFSESQELTEVGQILGTPEYMSPEQAMPTALGIDTRTDIYALGTMLYELCTGLLPFEFANLRRAGFRALQAAVCEQEAPPPSLRVQRLGEHAGPIAAGMATSSERLVRQLTGDLDWITGKALAKDRERRYATVSELAADVRRHLRHQPVQAGPPSTVYQLRKFVRRHRAGVMFAAVLLTGLIGALIVVTNLLVRVSDTLEGFDTLDDADEFALLEARADNDLWRNPDRLAKAGDLWPVTPDRLPLYKDWLTRAAAIADRLPEFHRQLAALEARGERRDDAYSFRAPRDKSLHHRLAPLVAAIERAVAAGGAVEQITQRRDWARNLREHTVSGPEVAAKWREAIAAIGDRARCPAYGGLRLEPQLGLVPLGRDERSGLHEFAFPQPGFALPVRGDGKWVMAEDSCMVFVLIPGGLARLGFDWPDRRLPADIKPAQTEFLPLDGEVGGSSFSVRLDPFFLSKYEMTQQQWLKLMQDNPSSWSPERESARGITMVHPVNTVGATTCDEAMRRLGLELPTSAQWEYAARAGAEAPWWTGFSPTGWYDAENLADADLAKVVTRLEFGTCDSDHADSFALTAPVDSKQPNPFGLHHVLGNVREWSRDPAANYEKARPGDGDGAMAPIAAGRSLDPRKRDVLGGSCITAWLFARSTDRTDVAANQASKSFGLRPARSILPR